jgi:hypothetical protein
MRSLYSDHTRSPGQELLVLKANLLPPLSPSDEDAALQMIETVEFDRHTVPCHGANHICHALLGPGHAFCEDVLEKRICRFFNDFKNSKVSRFIIH